MGLLREMLRKEKRVEQEKVGRARTGAGWTSIKGNREGRRIR